MSFEEIGRYIISARRANQGRQSELARLGRMFEILPSEVRSALSRLPEAQKAGIEEVRLCAGKNVSVTEDGAELVLSQSGALSAGCQMGITVSPEQIAETVARASDGAVYSAQESVRDGYITIAGGHRVGICGHAVNEEGRISAINSFSSLCIRAAKAAEYCAEKLSAEILSERGIYNTLIISPPMGGKTTLLRDLIRELSEKGIRVGVADERGEISGARGGLPQFELGPRTDVIEGAEKSSAVYMLLRTMSPRVIAMDEITEEKDAAALLKVRNCGVSVIATVHAFGVGDLERRKIYSELLGENVFERFVTIEKNGSERYARVFRKI